MKRHDSLIPLTHDHHHALAQARALKLAASRGGEDRLRQSREFLDFFETETKNHFREEEEVVFPLVVQEPEAKPVLERAMLDHLRIHALIRSLKVEVETGAIDDGTPSKVADALARHIRFEEKVVFPLIERILTVEALDAISLHSRKRSDPLHGNGQE